MLVLSAFCDLQRLDLLFVASDREVKVTTINTLPRAIVRGRPTDTTRLLYAAPYLVPALLIFAVFTYYPLAKVIYLSFTNADMLKPVPDFIGVQNYRAMFASREFWSSLGITAGFALGVTALEVGLGMALAFLMNAPTRMQGLLRGAVFAPVVNHLVKINLVVLKLLWIVFMLIYVALSLVLIVKKNQLKLLNQVINI